MLQIKKQSKWSFETSQSATLGASIIVAIQARKGAFYLNAPEAGGMTQFHYADLGVGYGVGLKLPFKMPKNASAGFSNTQDLSYGRVYILDNFRGDDLKASDLTGVCMFAEAAVSSYHGFTGTAMLLGIPVTHEAVMQQLGVEIVELGMMAGGTPPFLMRRVLKIIPGLENSAKAVLFMGGFGAGLQAGVSILGGLGAVWIGDVESLTIDVNLPLEPVTVKVRSSNTQQILRMIIPSDVLFDFNKHTIGSKRQPGAAVRTLSEVASTLRSYPSTYRIIIIGHTDSIGNHQYNNKLSEKRAGNVRDWLIRNGAIKAGRFSSVRGEGESEPVAPNNNPRGRAKNRRVEITLVPS